MRTTLLLVAVPLLALACFTAWAATKAGDDIQRLVTAVERDEPMITKLTIWKGDVDDTAPLYVLGREADQSVEAFVSMVTAALGTQPKCSTWKSTIDGDVVTVKVTTYCQDNETETKCQASHDEEVSRLKAGPLPEN